MKILLTGVTGYIGKRLLPVLVNRGYKVICCVRNKSRVDFPDSISEKIEVIESDFLQESSLHKIPKDIDGAFYLIHSMSSSNNYEVLDIQAAKNFRHYLDKTTVKHVIYLSGIANKEPLSKHLKSRQDVENELAKGSYNFTTLRAGIIIGEGSGSFEIIRDLVEKIPIIIAPKWLQTKCQPIGISDVTKILVESLFNTKTYNQNFDIGGPDILSYKEMLTTYAKIRELKRIITFTSLISPKIASFWLYFITSTSYKLAMALSESMKIEVICRNTDINKILDITTTNFPDALQNTIQKVESNSVVPFWDKSIIINKNVSDFINIPTYSCFIDKRNKPVYNKSECMNNIWHLASEDKINSWEILFANKKEGRLILFSETRLPGEAWLEFRIKKNVLWQTFTFRPKGVKGRLHWLLNYPIHQLNLKRTINKLAT